MFKPIRDQLPIEPHHDDIQELVPDVVREEESASVEPSKNEKNLGETKRRKSLPCFEPVEESFKPIQNVGETYDVSYYSSYVKENKDEAKAEYYSSFVEESFRNEGKRFGGLAVKSVSDECVYDGKDSGIYSKSTSLSVPGSEKTTKTAQDFYFADAERSKYRRISVTEPSSPAVENPFQDYSPSLPSPGSANEPEGRASDSKGIESDFSDAESEPDDELVSRIKKSKSFVDAKEDSQSKKLKNFNKCKARKSSASSTSSYDSSCRFHSRNSVEKFASENATPLKSHSLKKSTSFHPKSSTSRRVLDQKTNERRQHLQKSGRFSTFDRPSREKPSDVRKSSLGETEKFLDPRPAKRERAKSWNREPDNKGSLPPPEIDPDLYLYLLEVLTRKSRMELEEKNAEQEFFTKSLPRNHRSRFQKPIEENPSSEISRHLSSAMKCDKDCLKILKSVSKEKPEDEMSRSKCKTDYKETIIPRSEIEIVSTPPRTINTANYQSLHSCKIRQRLPERSNFPVNKSCFDQPEASLKKRSVSRERFKEEECVLRIEDGNLWIEICKAIQETESKNRKYKKTAYKT